MSDRRNGLPDVVCRSARSDLNVNDCGRGQQAGYFDGEINALNDYAKSHLFTEAKKAPLE
jgi:hypothetical protein